MANISFTAPLQSSFVMGCKPACRTKHSPTFILELKPGGSWEEGKANVGIHWRNMKLANGNNMITENCCRILFCYSCPTSKYGRYGPKSEMELHKIGGFYISSCYKLLITWDMDTSSGKADNDQRSTDATVYVVLDALTASSPLSQALMPSCSFGQHQGILSDHVSGAQIHGLCLLRTTSKRHTKSHAKPNQVAHNRYNELLNSRDLSERCVEGSWLRNTKT